MKTPWEKFSLPGDRPAYARGESAEFRKALREIFGPLVERVGKWPTGALEWLMAEYLFSRAAPIYGGSQEIQRTLVAQRVLHMPKES